MAGVHAETATGHAWGSEAWRAGSQPPPPPPRYNRETAAVALESGAPVGEEGIDDAFELVHEIADQVGAGNTLCCDARSPTRLPF